MINQVKYDVEHGSPFANALAEHPKVFSDLYINMVKAGETGGVLGVVLARLAEFAEGQRNLKNEVVSALFYPAVLFALSGLAIAVLMVAVVPNSLVFPLFAPTAIAAVSLSILYPVTVELVIVL